MTFGSILAGGAAAAFLALGAGSLAAPRALSENYGLPVDGPDQVAYLRALGMRDAVLGLIVAVFLARGAREPLATTLALSALVGAADFTLVFRARGRAAGSSLLIHGTGTLGLLAVAALVRAGR
jgi:hypothetical protein